MSGSIEYTRSIRIIIDAIEPETIKKEIFGSFADCDIYIYIGILHPVIQISVFKIISDLKKITFSPNDSDSLLRAIAIKLLIQR